MGVRFFTLYQSDIIFHQSTGYLVIVILSCSILLYFNFLTSFTSFIFSISVVTIISTSHLFILFLAQQPLSQFPINPYKTVITNFANNLAAKTKGKI